MATNKFKDKNHRWFTEGLFLETSRSEHVRPSSFVLNPDNETEERPSLKRLYLECADPTEYKFATEVLGGLKHLRRLEKCSWFRPHLEEWREELEIKLRSEGIQAQRKLAAKGNVNASKWLAEKGWDKRKAGAPSKEETTRERKVSAKMEDELEEHFKRVFN
jgi:hypothetical protein